MTLRALDDNYYASNTDLNGTNANAAEVLSRLHGHAENNVETKRCCKKFNFLFVCLLCAC